MAKEKKPLLKKWTVWYDPFVEDYYVVLKTYKNRVILQWLRDGLIFRGFKSDCLEDRFIRVLTPLEKELL
jgi:hypothetical protein